MKPELDESMLSKFHVPIVGGAKGEEAPRAIPPLSGTINAPAEMEAFRADPLGFDAVLTDERMPGPSGAALMHEIWRLRQSISIFLVSGYVGGMVASRAYNEGADEVLKKPLSMQNPAASLARVFRQ